MNQKTKTALFFSVILFLAIAVIGLFLFYIKELTLKENKSFEGYALAGAYLKSYNIWLTNFRTKEEVKLTDISTIFLYEDGQWKEHKIDEPKIQELDRSFAIGGAGYRTIWSPSGRILLYGKTQKPKEAVSSEFIKSDLYMFDMVTQTHAKLASAVKMSYHNERNISFSPDGRKVAWSYDIQEQADRVSEKVYNVAPEIVVADIDMPQQKPMSIFTGEKGVGKVDLLQWFPDNKTIIVVYNKNSGYGTTRGVSQDTYSVLAIDVSTQKAEIILAFDRDRDEIVASDIFFDVSSDGRYISYITRDKEKRDVKNFYVFSFDTRAASLVYSFPKSGRIRYRTFWSPNSESIAIIGSDYYVGKDDSLTLILRDGKIIQKFDESDLFNVTFDDGTPAPLRFDDIAWSPDSQHIAVSIRSSISVSNEPVWEIELKTGAKEKVGILPISEQVSLVWTSVPTQ